MRSRDLVSACTPTATPLATPMSQRDRRVCTCWRRSVAEESTCLWAVDVRAVGSGLLSVIILWCWVQTHRAGTTSALAERCGFNVSFHVHRPRWITKSWDRSRNSWQKVGIKRRMWTAYPKKWRGNWPPGPRNNNNNNNNNNNEL